MELDPIIKNAKNISDIAPKAYDDIIHPSAQNIGAALGTVTDLLNTILTPIEILNETVKINKKKFLEDYSNNLNEVSPEKQCIPNFEIAGPILDHLKFKITEDTLREKYAKLLCAASNSDSLTKPLLSFDNVLNQLSPYEIRLLAQLFGESPKQIYALASIKKTSQLGYRFLYKNIPDISFENLGIDTISVMISNFERLGLINIDYIQFIEPDNIYDYIYKSPLFLSLKEACREERRQTNQPYPECYVDKHSFSLTEFGRDFVSTVIY